MGEKEILNKKGFTVHCTSIQKHISIEIDYAVYSKGRQSQK